MKIDVIEKKENPFLKRIDLLLTVDHTGQPTPKKDDLIKEIAGNFNSTPEKVTIDYIFSGFGLYKAKIKAKIWSEKPPEKKLKKKEPKPEKAVEKKEEKKEEPKKEDEKK